MLNSEIKAVFKNNEKAEYFPVMLNRNPKGKIIKEMSN